MKKYILLTLTLIALAFNAQAGTGGGDPWYYYYIKVNCEPSGAGLVYAKNVSITETDANDTPPQVYKSDKTHKSNITRQTWYLATKPIDGTKYKFVGWREESSKKIVSDKPTYNFKWNSALATLGETDDPSLTNTGNEATHWNGVISDTYTAVYEEIINQYVSCSSAQPDLGVPRIDKSENAIGDEVTLSAHPAKYTTKFKHWLKDGVFYSKDRIISFVIDNETKGHYTAVFESGYSFFRIKNVGSSRFINAIKDQGSIKDFSALQLIDKTQADYEAGSIWNITDAPRGGGMTGTVYSYKSQDFSSSIFYNTDKGIGEFMTSDHDIEMNTWTIYPNGQNGFYMADQGESNVSNSSVVAKDIAHWYYEPMDKDLTTKENYFTFDPEKLLLDETTGKYYTTLRTAWNVLFDTNEIKAYIVTGVDENGVLIKTEVTGGIIPKNTCVLIECNSNDTDRNVMVPTNTAASFTATSGNILVSSEKYFPNQNAPAGNYKALTLVDGAVGFGGEACSKINGNDAYYPIDDDVFVSSPKLFDLTTVISENNTTKKYNMTDLICVMAVPDEDGNAVLYCKDDNKYANPDIKGDNEKDYILNTFGGVGYRNDHDQSNWIALYAPASLFAASQQAPGLMAEPMSSSRISELAQQKINNVVGTVTDVKNPSLTLKTIPVSKEANEYTFNTYVPANFHGSQYGYFFVSPKPMEVAQIRWAMWTGDHFESVTSTATTNTAGLVGAFDVNWSLMNTPVTPVANHVYDFLGLVKIESAANNSAYAAMGTLDRYVVYPFNLEEIGSVVDGIVTGIDTIDSAMVKSVKYYNMLGVESDTPHEGVNIIVTTMDNGTKKTSKRIF